MTTQEFCLSRSDQGEETPHGKLNLTLLLRANILRIVAIKLKQLLVYWCIECGVLFPDEIRKKSYYVKKEYACESTEPPPPRVTVSKGNFPENKTDFVLSNNKKEISIAAPSNH